MFFLTSEFYISDVFHKISPKPISLEIRYPLRAIVVSLKPGLSAQKPYGYDDGKKDNSPSGRVSVHWGGWSR